MEQHSIAWRPQKGPQKALIDCPFAEVFFGGARGGGKTDAIIGKYGIKAEIYGRAFNGIFFRKELPQADDLIDRAKEVYLPVGAQWYEQKKQFVFRRGGRLRFRSLEKEKDAEKYQGQNVSDGAVEEAGNYADSRAIDKLFGAIRSKHGIPTQLIITANPGGAGHGWLKRRYINPAPLGMRSIYRVLPNGNLHRYIFIPSRLEDNPILTKNDPEYENRLFLTGGPELARAWRYGDWNIHEGAFFAEFGDHHIVPTEAIPRHWPRYLGFDWGYESPFCALWGAVSSGRNDDGSESRIPKGAIVIYREWTGRHLSNEDIGRGIAQRSEGEDLIAHADPSIFTAGGGKSIKDQMGYPFRPADNDRQSGWMLVRGRLKPSQLVGVKPLLYFQQHCQYIIESIGSLPRDPKKPEDADTTADDHGPDALRYLVKARHITADYIDIKPDVTKGVVTVAEYIKRRRRQNKRARL